MSEESPVSVKLFPSQLHCCMSDAKMDAPLRRARFSMNAIVTFCVCVCVCVRERERERERETDRQTERVPLSDWTYTCQHHTVWHC